MRMMRRRYAYTYGDYLMLEAEAPAMRHEFIDGEIVAMAGGSDLHSALIAALSGELYSQLRGTACGLRESNLRVRVQATAMHFTPTHSSFATKPTSCAKSVGAIRC
jgi:Uma2 family endonuclease